MKKLLFILLVISNMHVFAQHEHHMQADTTKKPAPMQHDTTMKNTDHIKMDMGSMQHDMPGMNHSYSLSLPMSRNGSGTSWLPDNTPMYMLMKHTKKGMWMFHGSVFLRYNNQHLNGKTLRSDAQFDVPNWFMAMYNRKVGKNGLLNFSAMISADPLTVTERGYPLLFQSGESYKGQSLVDRQHPHDFFSGVTIGYTQRLSKKVDVFGYFGYPGEPALGPPAFMHRIIALNDPDAVLGHHWQDATHITYGVATLGVRVDKLKLEGSSFTGREPDENRYDFDKMRFDSYSWRLSYNPDKAWAFQISQGYINSPELLHPHENVWRYTASAIYASPVDNEGRYFTGSVVWGLNHSRNGNEHAFLLEGTRQLSKQAIYSRYEFVQKSAEELALDEQFGNTLFNVHKFTLGTNRRLFKTGPIEYIGGIQASINLPSEKLHPLYGSNPMSGQVYIQIRPSLHK